MKDCARRATPFTVPAIETGDPVAQAATVQQWVADRAGIHHSGRTSDGVELMVMVGDFRDGPGKQKTLQRNSFNEPRPFPEINFHEIRKGRGQ